MSARPPAAVRSSPRIASTRVLWSSASSPRGSPRLSNMNSLNRKVVARNYLSPKPVDKQGSAEVVGRIEKKLDKLDTYIARNSSIANAQRFEKQLLSVQEELQSAHGELLEVKSSYAELERKYCHLQRQYEKLSRDDAQKASELAEIRKELQDRRRKSLVKKARTLQSSQSVNHNSTITIADEDEKDVAEDISKVENILLQKARERLEQVERENRGLKEKLETEKADHCKYAKDLLLAIRAASHQREEAMSEVDRWKRTPCSDPEDLKIWNDLMQKFKVECRRNALLAWCTGRLTAYPSINVLNFSTDFEDGKAFCALVHSFYPNLVDRTNLQGDCTILAEKLASNLGLKTPSVFSSHSDWRQIMSSIFELYKKTMNMDV